MIEKSKKIILFFLMASVASLLIAATPSGRGKSVSVRGYENLGRKYLEEGDLRNAVSAFRSALEQNENYIPAMEGIAKTYELMGDMERSAGYYSSIIEKEKENTRALNGLGRINTQLGNREEALKYLKQSYQINPGLSETNYALGLFYEKYGFNEIAEKYYERILRLEPGDIDALLSLASIEAKRKKFIRALGYAERASRFDPVNPEVHRMIGDIKLGMYRSDDAGRNGELLAEANQSFEKAKRLSPENGYVTNVRQAMVSFYQAKPEDSVNFLLQAIESNPAQGQIRKFAGEVLLGMKDNQYADLALSQLREAVRLLPADSMARYSLETAVLTLNGNPALSAELRRELADYHLKMMKYYENAGQFDKMRIHLRRALELNPDDELLTRRLEIHRREGDYELFLDDLIRLTRSQPGNYRLKFRLERALKNRYKSLPFRSGLTIKTLMNQEETNIRTPSSAIVFDFEPMNSYSEDPAGSILVADALRFHLRQKGCVAPVSENFRSDVMKAFRRASQVDPVMSGGIKYDPAMLNLIEERERGKERADFIIHGRYATVGSEMHVEYIIIEKKSESIQARVNYRASGPRAIHDISARAASYIAGNLPCKGIVLKSAPGEIFINLGKLDGVKDGDRLRISHRGKDVGLVKVVESSARLSRAIPGEIDWFEFGAGYQATPVTSEESDDTAKSEE